LTPRATLETYFRRLEGAKLDPLLELFHDNATFDVNGIRRSNGHAEIRASLERGVATATNVSIVMSQVCEDGNLVMAEAVLRGKWADTREDAELWFAAVAEVADGKFVRLAEYFQPRT
jgi:limonene-1,2-epoxide hydrolase